MSRRQDQLSSVVGRRLTMLAELDELAAGRFDEELIERISRLRTRCEGRLGHSLSHTVVALAGATGSGKSSLFNAVVGEDLVATGVLRPLTSVPEAVTFGEPAEELLDWLEIPKRHHRNDASLNGMILVDLPDHDSVRLDHRVVVDRLVEVVDVFCWVVDPEKYADNALHSSYLQRFAGHSATTMVVFNQIDRLDEPQLRRCLDDLTQLVLADGLSGVRILGTSTRTGQGVEELRNELGAKASEHTASLRRLRADLDWLGTDLVAACGVGELEAVTQRDEQVLVDAYSQALGVEALGEAVQRAARRRSSLKTGWPPLRWLQRRRPDPLRRLGVERSSEREHGRSSLPPADSVATNAVALATTQLVDSVTDHLPSRWRSRIEQVANVHMDDLADHLDQAAVQVAPSVVEPLWWRVVGFVQWVLFAIAVVGAVWLGAIAGWAWLKLGELEPPTVHGVPLPTVFLLGSVVPSLLVAALSRAISASGARRQRSRVERELRDRARGVARELVIDPVNTEIESLSMLSQRSLQFAQLR